MYIDNIPKAAFLLAAFLWITVLPKWYLKVEVFQLATRQDKQQRHYSLILNEYSNDGPANGCNTGTVKWDLSNASSLRSNH